MGAAALPWSFELRAKVSYLLSSHRSHRHGSYLNEHVSTLVSSVCLITEQLTTPLTMDMSGDDKENKETETRKYSAERCSDKKMHQCNDELISSEVRDFVREVVEAVAYTLDRLKTSYRSGKRTRDEIIEISDTDSTESTRKKVAHESASRYRKVTVKQLAEQEKRMGERKRIAAEKMKNRKAVVEEKRLKKEQAQKERERRKAEREERRKKKCREKERRRKEEEEKKERRRMEEEVRRQKKEKEEEERRKRRRDEEERRESKRKKEEAVELKKKRQSDRFLAFFDKRRKTRESEAVRTSSVLNVLPFFCKQGVSLAPMFRRKPLSKEVHDNLLVEVQPVEKLYLSTVKPRAVEKVRRNRAKLFQFHDNWRPPYYGTWRKRSTIITGRRPFAKDTEALDYEVDSDEEWEVPEGDDCDEITMSEEEDSDQSSDDDGFIVQHGYLSEGEGEDEQDRLERREDSDKRAQRLRAMANEWNRSLEQKSKKFNKPLIPILWGPHFKLPTKGVPKEVEEAVFFEYSDDDDDTGDYYGDNDSDESSNSCHDDDIYVED
ncbi:unnamed protein product [Litomosoides sigmodontis]|uniref:Chromatin assembly factor 1 subunit A dimerization domain-containing protein n=1 Tax=Litomosoides sigmodontis TaxID=42156 RepID=A0A3P6SQ81_LITSI|nr:unnamed protein product [Litomosoides sigmodontis]